MVAIPPLVTAIRCPYRPEGCDWEYRREDSLYLSLLSNQPGVHRAATALAQAGVRHLERQNQAAADAIREHLNSAHPGWSLEEIEFRAKIVEQPAGSGGIVIEGEVLP